MQKCQILNLWQFEIAEHSGVDIVQSNTKCVINLSSQGISWYLVKSGYQHPKDNVQVCGNYHCLSFIDV